MTQQAEPQGADDEASLAARLARLPATKRREILRGLNDRQIGALLYDWRFWARPKQIAPKGDWTCWAIVAGRGFGKTRAAVEWVRELIEGRSPLTAPPAAPARIALVAQTARDAREVMVDGESGFLACSPPGFRPRFEASRLRLVWPNGSVGQIFSAEEPDQLRGPQHHAAWCDEIAKWSYGEAAWSNLLLGLRLGAKPRVAVTTTPRPIPLLRGIIADPGTVTRFGATYENRANLPRAFFDAVIARYEGTRLGRQELGGEILEDTPGALFTRAVIEAAKVEDAPPLTRVVVAIDPPASAGPRSSACGIVVAGLGADGCAYVLADKTVHGASPRQWAAAAAEAFRAFQADRVVAEVNHGGDMVEAVIRQIAPSISYRAVRASRGKAVRAEPVAALYEQGRVRHVRRSASEEDGGLFALEDQMCAFTRDWGAQSCDASPDRVDALVWAITDLMLMRPSAPRVRALA